MIRFAAILALTMNAASASAGSDAIRWDVQPDFESREAGFEISGAVCAGAAPAGQWCYAVNDEKKYIQIFTIEGETLIPGDRVRILESKDSTGEKLGEPDLEAASYHDGYVYFAGSNGASRKKGIADKSRFLVYRLPVDPETGAPEFEISRTTVARQIERSDKLRRLIAEADGLSRFAEKPLRKNGANIEGMALAGGAAFFGFRAPASKKGAVVLEVPINVIFGVASRPAIAHRVRLGTGYGVRDMAPLGDGFLILAGAAGSDDLTPEIWWWKPGINARLLERLGVPASHKAEAVMVLDETKADAIRVLVLFDSQKNGGPLEFSIPNPL